MELEEGEALRISSVVDPAMDRSLLVLCAELGAEIGGSLLIVVDPGVEPSLLVLGATVSPVLEMSLLVVDAGMDHGPLVSDSIPDVGM